MLSCILPFWSRAAICNNGCCLPWTSCLVAAAVSLGSGYIFHIWDLKAGKRDASVAGSLPMMIFWWGAGVIALLYALGWLLERYCLELWH